MGTIVTSPPSCREIIDRAGGDPTDDGLLQVVGQVVHQNHRREQQHRRVQQGPAGLAGSHRVIDRGPVVAHAKGVGGPSGSEARLSGLFKVEFGYPERFVQEQVGHAWAATTALYTGVSDEYRNGLLRQALSKRDASLWEDQR